MLNKAALAVIAATILFGCAAHAEAPASISLQSDDEGSFEVVHSRATTTATSAVFFGLIGAAVTSSQEKGEDDKRAEMVLPHIADPSCHDGFVAALQDRLQEKSITLHAGPDSPGGDRILWLRIDSCGFKLVDADSAEVSTYFAAEYAFLDEPARKRPKDRQSLFIVGRDRFAWSEVVADPETAAARFAATRAKAGRRMANKIIYNNR